jgi:hypothetical protein
MLGGTDGGARMEGRTGGEIMVPEGLGGGMEEWREGGKEGRRNGGREGGREVNVFTPCCLPLTFAISSLLKT